MTRRGPYDVTAADDYGLSVIEVVLYTLLSAVVGAVVLSLVISTLTGQESVTSMTQASGRGQAISQSLDRALRNAEGIDAYTDGSGNKVLVVRTTLDRACQAWRVTPGGMLEVSTGAGFASWGELAEGVEPVGTNPYFGWTGARFRYSFALATEGQPLLFTGAIMPRGTSGTVGTSCS